MSARKGFLLLALVIVVVTIGFLLLKNGRQKVSLVPVSKNDTVAIDIPLSVFRIPVSYSTDEFSEYISDKFSGRFLEAVVSPTKNPKDQVKVELNKVGKIRISVKDKKLQVLFPLTATATIIRSRLNFITKGIEPLVTELELELRTPAELDSSWRLLTHFSLVNIKWIKPPKLEIAGIEINLTDLVNKQLEEKKEELCRLLDREVHKAVSLEKPVGKVWTDLQKVIVVKKDDPKAYLKFICQNIYGDLELNPGWLVCYTNIEVKVAMVSETSLRAAAIPLPAYRQKIRDSLPSDVYVYAFAEFDVINNELNQKLEHREISGKNISITIQKVNVFTSDSGLTVKLDTGGDIQTSLVAFTQPVYDSSIQSFKLENFQFQLESANNLLELGDAVLHDKLQNLVQEKLVLGMDSLILKVPSLVENAIARGKPGKTIEVSLDSLNILSCDIRLDSKRIHFLVHTTFNAGLNIKELKSNKSIRIRLRSK